VAPPIPSINPVIEAVNEMKLRKIVEGRMWIKMSSGSPTPTIERPNPQRIMVSGRITPGFSSPFVGCRYSGIRWLYS
jgi:hypothetical protein